MSSLCLPSYVQFPPCAANGYSRRCNQWLDSHMHPTCQSSLPLQLSSKNTFAKTTGAKEKKKTTWQKKKEVDTSNLNKKRSQRNLCKNIQAQT